MSWYDDLAKKGYLGSKAKMTAESGGFEWDKKDPKDQVERAREKMIQSRLKMKDKMVGS